MGYIKNTTKSMFRRAGYDIHRLRPDSKPAGQLLKALNRFGVNAIFDVGANAGQFASELRTAGYVGRLISFEPTSDAHARLTTLAAGDTDWLIHPRCAVGDDVGNAHINIAENSVSSSVLPIMESHLKAAAGSRYIGIEEVPMTTLDAVVDTYLTAGDRPFLKIDTQGFEWQVLDGAKETLPRLCGVLCELSLVQLYEGQHLWLDMIDRLDRLGFTLWTIQRGFTDPRDSRTLQIDATFFRV